MRLMQLFFWLSMTSYAQEFTNNKTFFQRISGEELQSSVVFMPFGTHPRNPDFYGVWYTAVNFKSVEMTYFRNSFGDPTVGVMYKRSWNLTKKFAVNYGLGFIYGYHGRLKDVKGIPFRDTFLIKNEINPVVGFAFDYKLYDMISLHATVAPNIVVYGFRYIFNKGK
jgi:hypothetical protein